jgi:hypothetical protein
MNRDSISGGTAKVKLSRPIYPTLSREEFILRIVKKYFTAEQEKQISSTILDQLLDFLFEEGEDWSDAEGQFQLEVSVRIYLEALLMKELDSKK